MPVTKTKILQRELNKLGPESEARNEKFIGALTAALGKKLLNYFDSADGASRSQSLELNEGAETDAVSAEREKRIENIKQVFNAPQFQIGAADFSVVIESTATELASVAGRETVEIWVSALRNRLLDYYHQAPTDQRLRRLGEISFMFRASTFQVGDQSIKIAANRVNAATDIASFQDTYGCPPGTMCIDGNCV